MRTTKTVLALAGALALTSGGAFAADQLIAGKKLLIKNPPSGLINNKIVYLSKDVTIAQPSGATEDPRCQPDGTALTGGASASLTVTGASSGETFSIPLICDNWSVNGGGNLFKYQDSSGNTCKLVLVKDGRLVKAICKGPQVSFDLGLVDSNVDVVLRTGPTNRYCAAFNATTEGCTIKKDGTDDKTYLAKNCSSGPAACGASPSGAFVEVAELF